MKKILFFIPTLGGGGAETVLVNLVNNLDTSKYEITIQTLFDVGINKKRINHNIKYKYIFKKMFRGNIHILKLFSPSFLFKKFIKSHYDIIISYLEGPTTRIVSGCEDKKTKLIAWVHTEIKNIYEFSSSYRNKGEMKKAYEKYNEVIFVSTEAQKSFNTLLKYNIKSSVIENVIDNNEIQKKAIEPITLERFKKDSNLKIISLGRLIKLKGYKRLLDVHKELISKNIMHSIYIFGEGKERRNLEKIIKKNHLESTVCLCGYVENPYKYIKNCDVYVCSSYKEGYNTAIVEALALEKPIITTFCSGVNSILDNGQYGMIVENSENGLFNGLKEMITKQELREEYRKKSKQRNNSFSNIERIKKIEGLFL